jgi:hypothetical protein
MTRSYDDVEGDVRFCPTSPNRADGRQALAASYFV